MNANHDDYWDDLGVAWRAINPESSVIAPRLQARLRRQSVLIAVALMIGLPLAVIGVSLGVFTMWRGWTTGTWNFVARGLAIAVASMLLAIAMLTLLAVRAAHEARAVLEMLDLAIARAKRTLMAIRLGMIACAVTVLLGLAGTAIRTQLSAPPQMSPVVDVVLLAMCALGLFVWGREVRVRLAQWQALKRAFGADADA